MDPLPVFPQPRTALAVLRQCPSLKSTSHPTLHMTLSSSLLADVRAVFPPLNSRGRNSCASHRKPYCLALLFVYELILPLPVLSLRAKPTFICVAPLLSSLWQRFNRLLPENRTPVKYSGRGTCSGLWLAV